MSENTTNINNKLTVGRAIVEPATSTNGNVLFSLQPYIEKEHISDHVFFIHQNQPTIETLDDPNAPYAKVLKFTGYNNECTLGEKIPVSAGERIYLEAWYMVPADDTGTAGLNYLGVRRYDKDNKRIAGNDGRNYLVSALTLTVDGNWHKMSGYYTVESSHTPYTESGQTSDGGAVRYLDLTFRLNFNTGTQEIYVSGLTIKKVNVSYDEGDTAFKGDVGIGTDDPSARLHVKNEEDGVSEAIKITSSNAAYTHTFSPDVAGYNFDIDTVVTLNLKANIGTDIKGANATWRIGNGSGNTQWDIVPSYGGRNGSGNGIGNLASIYAGLSGRFGFWTIGTTNRADVISFDRTDNDNYGVNLLYANDSVTDGTKVEYVGLNLDKDGNVGIGITNQEAKLHVVPESNGSGIIVERFEGGNIFEVKDQGDAGLLTVGYTNFLGRKFVIDGGVSNTQAGFSTYDNTGTEKMRFSDGFGSFMPNNLKIGGVTVNNNARLHIIGETTASEKHALLIENSGGTEMFKVQNNGYVGINTTDPKGQLHVSDGVNAISSDLITTDYIILSGTNTAPGQNILAAGSSEFHRGVLKATRSRGSLASPAVPVENDYIFSFLGATYKGDGNFAGGAIDMFVDGTVTTSAVPTRISFSTTDALSRVERLTIKSDGDIGINTTSPTARLHVKAASAEGSLDVFHFQNSDNSDYLTMNNAGRIELRTANAIPFIINRPNGNGVLQFRNDANEGSITYYGNSEARYGTGVIQNGSNFEYHVGYTDTNTADLPSMTSRMVLKETGQLKLNAYTSVASFPGTAAANLAVKDNGEVVTTMMANTALTRLELTFDANGEVTLSLNSATFASTFTLESTAAEFLVIDSFIAANQVVLKLYDHTGTAVANATRHVHYTYSL